MIPHQQVDNCLEPAKAMVQLQVYSRCSNFIYDPLTTAPSIQNHNIVISFVASVIDSFLVRHGFASKKAAERRSSRDDGSPSPRKRRRIVSDNRSCDELNDGVSAPQPEPLHVNPVGTSYRFDWRLVYNVSRMILVATKLSGKTQLQVRLLWWTNERAIPTDKNLYHSEPKTENIAREGARCAAYNG